MASWIYNRLAYARARGWRGRAISGYRTPAQQEAAAQQYMRRTGQTRQQAYPNGVQASNHVRKGHPNGAVDVTDPGGLASAMSRWAREGHRTPLLSRIEGDPNHFSASGR